MSRISVVVAPSDEITLSAGPHNELVKKVIEDFCTRFAPGAEILFVGGAREKRTYAKAEGLRALGVSLDGDDARMPDVVVHHRSRGRLLLIEAVTSHGPVNPKRRAELQTLFKTASAGLVFVTAFHDRRAMTKYLGEISWETEAWVADAPSHMIHFNGERFLGPY